MSYCRFSSDCYNCDVYVYEDVNGGWTTHVASSKLINHTKPKPKDIDLSGSNVTEAITKMIVDSFVRYGDEVKEYTDSAERVNIELEHAGESFNDDTPVECADRLLYLRSLGYNVPQYAIDDLREEQRQLDNDPPK